MKAIGLLLAAVAVTSGENYDFGLYENFDINRHNIGQERTLVARLIELKDGLRDEISLLATEPLNTTLAASVKERMTRLSRDVRDAEHTFGTVDDFLAAAKALLILLDTYNPDLEHLTRGLFGNKDMMLPDGQAITVPDLIDLGTVAFNMNWLDHGVRLLNATKSILSNSSVWRSPLQATLPKRYEKMLGFLEKTVPKVHNALLFKRRKIAGDGFKLLPFVIGDDLQKAKRQPRFVRHTRFYERRQDDMDEVVDGDTKENSFRRVCAGKLLGHNTTTQGPQRCYFLHHDDPFLKVGPFKIEVLLRAPFRMLFHDFLTESEITWLIDYARPRLSRKRLTVGTKRRNHEKVAGKSKTIHKTVQCWIDDSEYEEAAKFSDDMSLNTMANPGKHRIVFPLLHSLSRKIEAATRMRVTDRWSSTPYQVTNYGLGEGSNGKAIGSPVFCAFVNEGKELTWQQKELTVTGDMLATFMAWLNDVKAGGATAFDAIGFEQRVFPRRGSAAFWIDLDKKGHREVRSSHGGCPVLAGSKWILNKWIFHFDQFRDWSCGLTPDEIFQGYTGTY